MVRYLRLLRLFFRTELQYELEYRLNLLLEVVQTIVVTATPIGTAVESVSRSQPGYTSTGNLPASMNDQ